MRSPAIRLPEACHREPAPPPRRPRLLRSLSGSDKEFAKRTIQKEGCIGRSFPSVSVLRACPVAGDAACHKNSLAAKRWLAGMVYRTLQSELGQILDFPTAPPKKSEKWQRPSSEAFAQCNWMT